MKLDWAFDITGTKLKAYAIAFVALVLLFVVVAVGSFYAGKRDQKDAQASKDVKVLTQALEKATKDLKAQQVGVAEAMRLNTEAQNRMSAIGERVVTQQQVQEKFSYETRDYLERALIARPDLADVRVGADILCAWNTANAGANSTRSTGAIAGATIPGCRAVSAVPEPATGRRRSNANLTKKPTGER